MRRVVLPLPGNEPLASRLASLTSTEIGAVEVRRFPDEESYLRLLTDVGGSEVAIVCTLDRPDPKLTQLLFAAATARELGARSVGLVAPYLAYMRQDIRFQPGEAVGARLFGALLSGAFDWLVTVDPHLHRLSSLDQAYRTPALAVSAAPALSAWLKETVARAILVGPDRESEQWVSAVAAGAGTPYVVGEKRRLGDREVEIRMPDMGRWNGLIPVVVDDIVSSARTMADAVRQLRSAGFAEVVCLGVHAIFAGGAYDVLRAAGAGRIVTCNTVGHPTNEIDLSPIIAAALPAVPGWGRS